mmetsp:Transcript_16891/g.32958  ORF Transcript_16891/g.32958 Transcript_16891/m.32958 type:complete len:80 (-) Transcript_16891:116-355(-)
METHRKRTRHSNSGAYHHGPRHGGNRSSPLVVSFTLAPLFPFLPLTAAADGPRVTCGFFSPLVAAAILFRPSSELKKGK